MQPARKSYDRGVLEQLRKTFLKEYRGGDTTATETEEDVSFCSVIIKYINTQKRVSITLRI